MNNLKEEILTKNNITDFDKYEIINTSVENEKEYYSIFEIETNRVIIAFSPSLSLKTHTGRRNNIITPKGFQPGDNRGHLIGDAFGGNNRRYNVVAQLENVNQKTYKRHENKMLKSLINNKAVTDFQIVITYKNENNRPEKFSLSYFVEGQEHRSNFNNTKEGK